MKYEVFSYRYAWEILQHVNYRAAWDEIDSIIRNAPVFTHPGKSKKNPRLYVVQQLMNTYFDRVFAIERGWEHHPLATGIAESKLRADYRKVFVGRNNASLAVQTEVQFGNMSRWYTDIFKFQTAYSQKLIQVGLSVIPMRSLAAVTDSNVVNFERAVRELPSADLSITLPIVVIGLSIDEATTTVDVSQCAFGGIAAITGKRCSDNRRKIIDAYCRGEPMRAVGPQSPVGPEIPGRDTDEADEESDDENA